MAINQDTIKKFAEQMKSAFAVFKDEQVNTNEQAFGKAVLPDGSVLVWEGEPAIGTPVNVETPEGLVPAASGEYTLEDGTVITIVDGFITEIEAPAEDGEQPNAGSEEAAPAQDMNGDTNAPQTTPKEVIERVEKVQRFTEDEVKALKDNITALSETVGTLTSQLTELSKFRTQMLTFNESVTKAIEELGDAPQATEKKEENFRHEETRKETIEEIRARLFNRNNKNTNHKTL